MIETNYHHLYYFYSVAKAGSIARAKESLLLSQPTISEQIKQLEEHFGRPLFHRRKRRMELTEDGRLVMEYAESIFSLGREMEATLAGNHFATGKLALPVGVQKGMHWIFPHALIRCVHEKYPQAKTIVREEPPELLVSEMRQHRLQLALADSGVWVESPQEFLIRRVGRFPIVFAAAPALARRYAGAPASLDKAPFILNSASGRANREILEFLENKNIRPRIAAEVPGIELARRLAAAGFGIAPLNAYIAATRILPHDLRPVYTPRPLLYENIYLIAHRRQRPSPLIDQVFKSFRLPAD